MSNLSTLPKGDSAWLLRKAIQRIIQQVSVLETNIGSSTTGNSLDKQVIFNDNGVLRGDTGLQFNPTTDTLQAGLLVVPGNTQLATVGTLYVGTLLNPKLKVDVAGTGVTTITEATITGDLTVKTNVLKVDSTNNRVGIGTASPAFALDVQGSVAGAVYGSVANNDTGGSGSARFRVFNSGDTSDGFAIINNYGAAGQVNLLNYKASSLALWTNSLQRLTLDSSGNLGLGVTPSAWSGSLKAIEIGELGSAYAGGGNNALVLYNTYFNGGFKYAITGRAASYYQQTAGAHNWFNAAVGTAGNAITFTQAMTLDASGNLLVGATSSNGKLTVKVPSLVGDQVIFAVQNAASTGMIGSITYNQTTDVFGFVNNATGASTVFSTNATERVRVKSYGQLRFVPLAADPSGAEAGDVYYNSSSNKLKCYNGTTWNDLF